MNRPKITFHSLIGLIIALSILLRLVYLGYTDFKTRTYDVVEGGGHLDYIGYVLRHHSPPDASSGWEYHQPPLYYYAAASLVGLTGQSVSDSVRLLQIASLVFSVGLTVAGTAIFCRLFSRKRDILIATLLLSFWPSGIIHSVRIGNDGLAQLFFAITVLFLVAWVKTKRTKDLVWGLLFTALTVFTKKTGFILAGVYGFMFLYLIARRQLTRKSTLIIVVSSLVLVISGFLSVQRNIVSSLQHEKSSVLVGKITINRGLYIGNRPGQFLLFDPGAFITRPYTGTWRDDMGRQSFPFFLMKSVLFAEFSFGKPFQPQIALVMSVLFLIFCMVAGAGFAATLLENRKEGLLMALVLCLSVLFLLLFRLQEPYASNQDFRYIYPTIIPLIYGYLQGVRLQRGKVPRAIGYLIPCAMTVLTIVFFLIPAAIR